MSGIAQLREIQEKRGEAFLKGLLEGYVIINEKMDGTFFGVKKTKNDEFKYFKKSGELTYVDRVLMQYYNPAIEHFESLPIEKRQRIPANFFFGFEYVTSRNFAAKNNKQRPNSGLVLSYIQKLGADGQPESSIQTKARLDPWADYLEVDRAPIIFEGRLNDEQKTEILEFVYAPTEKLIEKFKTTSFTKHILSVLNGQIGSEPLGDDERISEIVFRFYERDSDEQKETAFLAKLIDPLFQAKKEKKEQKNLSQDYIWLIVIDLMNHFESYDLEALRQIAGDSGSYEEKYLRLINSIFKDFIRNYEKKYEGLILELPEYLNRPEFKMDLNLILEPEVKRLIRANDTYAEIYKILLNFFRKNRKKSSSDFFTPELLSQLNLIVNKLRNIIMGNEVYEGLFPSFNEYLGAANEEYVLGEKEALEEKKNKPKPAQVNLLIGKFQPINIGHIKAAEKLRDKNELPCVLVAIKPAKRNPSSPFSTAVTQRLLERVQQEKSELLKDYLMVEEANLEKIIESLTPNYEPALIGSSEEKIKDFVIHLEHIKKRKIPLRFSSKIKLVELPKYIKAEEVIRSIKDSDFNSFKKMAPASIASEFFNLQKDLESLDGSAHTAKLLESNDSELTNLDPKLEEKA